jgi:hypothetical protein
MWEIMNACVTMHNMIIKSEREHPVFDTKPYHHQGPLVTVDHHVAAAFAAFLAMCQEIRDANTHRQLQDNLVEHLWMLKGNTAYFYFWSSIYLDFKLCIISEYELYFE